MPKVGDTIQIPHRTSGELLWYVWVVCPDCGEGRYVTKDFPKKITFTGRCQKCHLKVTKRDFYRIME